MLSLLTSMQVANEERSEMQELFTRVDSDQDGLITKQELELALGEVYGDIQLEQFIMKQLISSLDLNSEGMVSFGEFIQAIEKRQQFTSKQ